MLASTTENPFRLDDICLKFIATNIDAVFADRLVTQSDGSRRKRKCFRGGGDALHLHSNLSDAILSSISAHGMLTDETLALFEPSCTALSRVKFYATPMLSSSGLRILRSHRIIELEATGLRQLPVNELIGCLGEWTLDNIRALNVSGGLFTEVGGIGIPVVVSLLKLRTLRTLNVSSTTFNTGALEMVVTDLPHLTSLDISGTAINDLSPLIRCRQRLRSLSMYNLRVSDATTVLVRLERLQFLDVSEDFSIHPFITFNAPSFDITDLLVAGADTLPELVALDVSGKHDMSTDHIRFFVECHPKLQFLGLALLPDFGQSLSSDKVLPDFLQQLTTTGETTEEQLMESLRRYKTRPSYVKRALLDLFRLTQDHVDDREPRTDLVKVILPAMRCHLKDVAVQLAATACFYNLMAHLRSGAGDERESAARTIHPRWLCEVVEATLDGMENFPLQQQLIKNCLLMLCSDRILQDLNFDKYRCTKLVLDSLCAFDEPSMNRLAVAICGILAAKIPTTQTSLLGGNPLYMKKLLKIVKNHIALLQPPDVTLKFTLSALWNLSDEAPATCEVFVSEGGLEIFMDVYEAFKSESEDMRVQVEVKLLGFLNNMAEVPRLRKDLLREDIMVKIRNLLHSSHQDISYFSAGILSHLLCGGRDSWPLANPSRQEMLIDLQHTVLNWKQPEAEMVAYRSFVPFFPLLQPGEEPAVQLWALWAWHHVCSMNGKRYCTLLLSQQCEGILKTLLDDPNTNLQVIELINRVSKVVTDVLGISWFEQVELASSSSLEAKSHPMEL